jgi:hypothetical protein
MFRLLEKEIGVSPDTLVWKTGMAEWQRMAEVGLGLLMLH